MQEKTALQIALEEAEVRKGSSLTKNEKELVKVKHQIDQDSEELKKALSPTETLVGDSTTAMCTHCEHIKKKVDPKKPTYHCPGCQKFTSTRKALILYEEKVAKPEREAKEAAKKKAEEEKKKKEVKKKTPTKKVHEKIEEAKKKAIATGKPVVVATQKKKKTTAKKPTPIVRSSPEPGSIVYVSPKKIVVREGFNKRFDFGDMKGFDHSIETRGVRIPIVARVNSDGDLELVAGERRLRSALKAYEKDPKGVCKQIPVLIRKYVNESRAIADLMIENDHKPFNPLEQALVVAHMRDDLEMKIADIAFALGKRQTWVRSRLLLVDAGEKVQTEMLEGRLSVTDACELMKEAGNDEDKQEVLILKRKLEKRTKKKKLKQRVMKGTGRPYTPKRVKQLLAELSSAFTRFERSGGPAKDSNDDWADLLDILDEIRKAKKEGRLSF